ncbi:MAG: hypothetical protein ACE5HW_06520 [Candidatus Methanofastidiosia archaeon]
MVKEQIGEKVKDTALKSKEKISEKVKVTTQRMKEADLDEKKEELARRIEEFAEILREKDLNKKRDLLFEKFEEITARVRGIELPREEMAEKVKDAEKFIREHPIASVGAAVALGFMFGSILRK